MASSHQTVTELTAYQAASLTSPTDFVNLYSYKTRLRIRAAQFELGIYGHGVHSTNNSTIGTQAIADENAH